MSATRPTPETDAATFWGRDMGGDKGPPHFECVDAEVARKFECERDDVRAIVSACMSAMPVGNIQTHTPENLAARIGDLAFALATEASENKAIREAMRETADILAQIPAAYDSRFFRAGQWANAAIAKLQPFIKP